MDDLRTLLKSKKIRLNLIIISLLVLFLPVGIILVKQAQNFFSKAEAKFIEITEGNCVSVRKGVKVLTCADVPLKLINPFIKPNATPTSTATPKPTGSGTASPTPSGGSTSPTPSGGTARTVNVKDFQNNIQAALDSLKTTGGAVYLPAGTYTVPEKIRVFSNITLFGDGMGQTIINVDQDSLKEDKNGISNDSTSGKENIVIRDLTVEGPNVKRLGDLNCCSGILLRGVKNSFVINVESKNWGLDGIYMGYRGSATESYNGQTVKVGARSVRISGCKVSGNQRHQIIMSNGTDNVIDNCQISASNSVGADFPSAAIDLEPDPGGDVFTRGNKLIGNSASGTNGFLLLGVGGESGDPAVVSGNAVCNNSASVSGSAYVDGGNNNVFSGNSGGSVDVRSGTSGNSTSGGSACEVPSNMALPPAPAKPTSSVKNSIWKFFSLKPGTVFAQNNSATSLPPNSYTYRLAESEAELSNAEWKPYITNSSSTSNTPTTSQSINNGTTSKLSYVDSAAGKIVISGVSDIEKPFNGLGLLATLNVKVKDNAPLGPTSINFDFDPNNLNKTTDSNVVERGTVVDVLKVVNNGNYSIGPDKTCPAHPTLWPAITNPSGATLSMATTDLDRGCLNFLLIYLDSGGRNIDGVDAILIYDPNVFEISTSSIQTDNAIFPNYYRGNQVLGESIQSVAITNFTLSDETPGPKQIWVEFQDPTGKTLKDHITFDLAEKDPEITALNCTYDLARQNIKVAITGKRFGQKGNVAAGNALTQTDFKATSNSTVDILTWGAEEITLLFKNGNTALQSGQSLKIAAIRDDDAKSPITACQVDQSSISLGARVFCREPGKFDIDNVKVSIFYNPDDSKSNQKLSRVDETVTISKDGFVQGLKTKLQSGKSYAISIQAPNSLRRNAIFKASEGTTIINSEDGEAFILPIGDIAPVTNLDGFINTLDRSELVRQWRTLGDNTKKLTGDFNRDSRVNSVDWACMRYDFNSEDDPLPTSVPTSQNPQDSESTITNTILSE